MLGQMWGDGDHMSDGWWWVMSIGWLVVIALLVVAVVVLLRHINASTTSRREAEQILAARFARGELDQEEYEQRREVLRR
jgi:putative membrane protein